MWGPDVNRSWPDDVLVVVMTELVELEITITWPAGIATNRFVLFRSYVMAPGLPWSLTVFSNFPVCPEKMLVLLPPGPPPPFATYSSPLDGSYAAAPGEGPPTIARSTVLS